ncbi:Mg/Co/Ni transporter MgtE, CBS domain-containing [hydrothermal vent metagenome]|uniref:Mg/Co/Ni transporter MgtE, CBS domain-containing n=1 Tax=hydrothermal vent metagenome TaxID=652676 RepID=A0A3B0WKL3_9ZZZZ
MAIQHSVIEKSKLTEQLLQAVENQHFKQVSDLLSSLVPEEIAELLESTPHKERQLLWECLNSEQQGEILTHTNDEVRAKLLESLQAHELVKITDDLEADDITDIAQSLEPSAKKALLESLEPIERTAVETALSYPEDTAGGLMSMDFVTIRADITLDVVLRYLRKLGELPDSTAELFVRDRDDHYVGTLKLTSLLVNDEDKLVQNVLETDTPAIQSYLPAKEVAHIFEKNDLISAAVVNENNQILGRITIDDVVDIIREEAEHIQMASAGLDEEDDIFAPATRTAKRRTFWLGINLLTAIFASMVISLFDATIEQIVTLAILMPIIASMGGIAGTQTATIVIRALATGKLAKSNSRSLLIKETTVGLFNGLIWAILTAIAVQVLFNNWALSAIFGTAMMVNLLVAALAGALIPLILQRMKIDPALASGLMLTTVTDSIGFFVFLGLATIVLL